MKELESGKIDKQEIVREVHSQEVFIGSYRLNNGEVWWQLNMSTMRISKAELTNERVEMVEEFGLFGGKTGRLVSRIVRDLITKDGHIYEHAINGRNAKRKFLKRIKNAYQKEKFNQENS